MNLLSILLIGLGGSVGAVSRLVVDGVVRSRVRSAAPVGTVLINVSGSLVLGFLYGLVVLDGAPGVVMVVAGTGFCGGYTTFSTASFETVRLIQRGAYRTALAATLITLAAALSAVGAGIALAAAL